MLMSYESAVVLKVSDTYYFTKENHVLATDEEQTMPVFCESISVVYSFDRVLQYKIS